jgi:hypothetical protein
MNKINDASRRSRRMVGDNQRGQRENNFKILLENDKKNV